MTAAAPRPSPPPPAPPAFLGRDAEGRAVILSARAGRSEQLVVPTGYGKSVLLTELAPALDQLALTLHVPKAAPFGTFLASLAAALIAAGASVLSSDLAGRKNETALFSRKLQSLR